jgi:prepilin-type N-terminal cleavage/methylation domain-containing protein
VKKPCRKKNQNGFTLIELLVVISIIAMLLSILLPSLRKAKEAAQKTICGSNLHQIAVGLHCYAADYEGRLPLIRYWSQGTQDLAPANAENVNFQMSALYTLGYLESKELFYSPSDKERRVDSVGTLEHSFRSGVKVDNQQAWRLIEQGEVATYDLALTYSYQQVLHVAQNLTDINAEKYLRIEKYKTLVADRFCNDWMWSFHGGDETLSHAKNQTDPAEGNGRGWHVGNSDGSVVWGENDERIFEYMEDMRSSFAGTYHFQHGGAWFKYWGNR